MGADQQLTVYLGKEEEAFLKKSKRSQEFDALRLPDAPLATNGYTPPPPVSLPGQTQTVTAPGARRSLWGHEWKLCVCLGRRLPCRGRDAKEGQGWGHRGYHGEELTHPPLGRWSSTAVCAPASHRAFLKGTPVQMVLGDSISRSSPSPKSVLKLILRTLWRSRRRTYSLSQLPFHTGLAPLT